MPAKPYLRIDDVEPIRAGRQTALPTASEIALQRMLDKAGWTMEDYVRRVDSLRDENGEPHCEGCGQVEKKRKSNGEIKSLTLNLKEKKLFCEPCSAKGVTSNSSART